MSVRVMSLVWDQYPEGGGELILALALADWANDDGTSIWPAVATMATKTRLTERAVQYNLAKMVETGWLIQVSKGGGRGRTARYRIPVDKLRKLEQRVQNLHPSEKGEAETDKGCNLEHKRVKPIAPEPLLLQPSREPSGRATRLPPDFEMPNTWILWATAEQKTWTISHAEMVAAMFKDFWIAKAGRDGAKLDWQATWRNWVRKEGPMRGARGAPAIAAKPAPECTYVDRAGAEPCGMPNAKPDPLYGMKPICEHHHLKLAKPAVTMDRVNEHMANIKRAARAHA